jgi:hypothetical protein
VDWDIPLYLIQGPLPEMAWSGLIWCSRSLRVSVALATTVCAVPLAALFEGWNTQPIWDNLIAFLDLAYLA